MARNAEKAMTALARWRRMKMEEERGPIARRPALASECNDLRRAERWRMDVIREIARKIAQIQNPGLGEFKIRDLNDEINKLLKTKYHWEVRICELGGPDYKRIAPKMLDREGREVPGNRGYKYFGAAKDLPGIRELFEKPDAEEMKTKKRQVLHRLDASYYGYLDEDDGVILPLEKEQEMEAIAKAVQDWKDQKESPFDTFGEEEGIHLYEDSFDTTIEPEEYLSGEGPSAPVESQDTNKRTYEGLIPQVEVPMQKDIEEALLNRKKKELLEKYASEALLQQCLEARTLMGIVLFAATYATVFPDYFTRITFDLEQNADNFFAQHWSSMSVSSSPSLTTTELWKRAITPNADWSQKDDLLDAIYWLKQLVSALLGVLWGTLPLRGALAIAIYFLVCSCISHLYVTSFQRVDEEWIGGLAEVIKEGFSTAFATFLVVWILLVHLTHVDFPDVIGSWAVWPLLESLDKRLKGKNFKWVFFLQPTTRIDVKRLRDVLQTYDENDAHFLGHALKDDGPTIVHHFYREAKPLLYPNYRAGFALSRAAFLNLVSYLKNDWAPKTPFTIDAQFELALIAQSIGLELTDTTSFCTSFMRPDCVTQHYRKVGSCTASDVDFKDVIFAVRTWHQNHDTRVKVLKDTWAKGKELRLYFFSDVEDPTIPTVKLKTKNTKAGHCAKTMEILSFFEQYGREKSAFTWLVLTDDDTLLNAGNLLKLLECFDSSMPIHLGQRYGFNFNKHGTSGYDYITFGGGSVFSSSAIGNFVSACKCPKDDSPDDMFLGSCASVANVDLVHSSLFHQNRPYDYNDELLEKDSTVSFHSFWAMDPIKAYHTYLVTESTANDTVNEHENESDESIIIPLSKGGSTAEHDVEL
ncbi:Isy1 and Fringe and Rab5ip domain containing prot ein [Trichuris trichiura]|uniref:Isy1 and Fringe and Rab5ip domain containing prot ein n=1 Tax=Trichuris trichiura TaxID=36087 RepID=A0A077ZIN7_TRITR|nr:Isy1 and Fringe and Rab5ip domain containing prot ein [Trichuris trichiura]